MDNGLVRPVAVLVHVTTSTMPNSDVGAMATTVNAATAAAAIRSANGYRSWIRRHIDSLATQTGVLSNAPSSEAKTRVNNTIATLQDAVDKATAKYLIYSESEPDRDKVKEAEKRASEMVAESEEAIAQALLAINRANRDLESTHRAPAAAAAPPTHIQWARSDITPRQARRWSHPPVRPEVETRIFHFLHSIRI